MIAFPKHPADFLFHLSRHGGVPWPHCDQPLGHSDACHWVRPVPAHPLALRLQRFCWFNKQIKVLLSENRKWAPGRANRSRVRAVLCRSGTGERPGYWQRQHRNPNLNHAAHCQVTGGSEVRGASQGLGRPLMPPSGPLSPMALSGLGLPRGAQGLTGGCTRAWEGAAIPPSAARLGAVPGLGAQVQMLASNCDFAPSPS